MSEYGVPENELEGTSHWEPRFDNLPGDPMNLFDPYLPSDLSNPYPDSYSLSIADIEHLWMEDDNEDGRGEEAVVEQPQADLDWTDQRFLVRFPSRLACGVRSLG